MFVKIKGVINYKLFNKGYILWTNSKKIRPIALGLVKRDGKVLVSIGHDNVKGTTFYRCIGGGIEFQETSKEALKREFKEELGCSIEVEDFLGINENIFVYNGKKGHEIVLFYNVSMSDEDYKDTCHIIDEEGSDAVWVDISKQKSKELIIYPEQVVEYL